MVSNPALCRVGPWPYPDAASRRAQALACIPGTALSLGPATLRVMIRCCRSQDRNRCFAARARGSSSNNGRESSRAQSRVHSDPGSRIPLGSKSNVPVLSRTFQAVRWERAIPAALGLCSRGVSRKGKISGMRPSSAWRPGGHQPPSSSPSSAAASRAPRSAPVCPPDTIRRGKLSCRIPRGWPRQEGPAPGPEAQRCEERFPYCRAHR